jgi:hypothetical protein
MRLKTAAAMELLFRYGRRGGLAYPFVLLALAASLPWKVGQNFYCRRSSRVNGSHFAAYLGRVAVLLGSNSEGKDKPGYSHIVLTLFLPRG